MTTPISAVAASRRVSYADVQHLASEAGLSTMERDKLRDGGLERVPVASVGLVELVADVLAGLGRRGWRPQTCGSVVFTHSLDLDPTQLVDLHYRLCEALPSLRQPPLIITGRPCSIVHLGIELAAAAIEAEGRAEREYTALVLGADIAPTVGDRFFFGSAMGDAAVGLVLGGPPTVGELLSCCSTTHILACEGVASPEEDIQRFRAMNSTAIRATIGAALELAHLDWPDLAAIVPHTPYRQIWDTVATLARFPREAILDQDVGLTGHLNSNDVLVHLAAALAAGRIGAGDVVALVSPGFGGTRGCTVLRIGGRR